MDALGNDAHSNVIACYFQENTIIVQCLQADEDVETQAIRQMAREADPDGKRTVGVLTKPDKIETDCEGTPLEILLGQGPHQLALGYYVVRTPNQEVRGPASRFKQNIPEGHLR